MYLSMLSEESKTMFLELAVCLASTDGNFSEEEQLMISNYEKEMEVSYKRESTARDINETLERMARNCTDTERRIIIYEAIGLAMVDGKYDSSEKSLIETMKEKFLLSSSFVNQCEDFLKRYMKFQSELNRLVLGL